MTGAGNEAPGTPQPGGEDLAGQALEPVSAVDATRFAHASEAEMARILDFYDVRWEYEPQTFPILWNLDGDVVESFAPDFYLPDLGVFLEMTTLKQRLVRKKNRKLRRLRELYPDVRIKLFYARDFRAMMLKYGRLGLAESLSGTPGQVVPERPQADPERPQADPERPQADPERPQADPDAVAAVAAPLLAMALATDAPSADAEPVAVRAAPERTTEVQTFRATPRLRSKRRRRRTAITETRAERETNA